MSALWDASTRPVLPDRTWWAAGESGGMDRAHHLAGPLQPGPSAPLGLTLLICLAAQPPSQVVLG